MAKNRIKELRKTLGLTQAELAEKVGVDKAAVSIWENIRFNPTLETATQLAHVLGCSTDYLLGVSKDSEKPLSIKIPVLGTIPAGVPIEAIEDIIDYEEIPNKQAQAGNYFGLKVRGDSMLPLIRDGDVVIVKQQETAETNDLAVILVNGFDATLKQIKKDKDNGGIWIIPLNENSDFRKVFYSSQDINNLPVRIIGKVVELRRKF